MPRTPAEEHPDTNPTVNTEPGRREPPPSGFARKGNYEEPQTFDGGAHDPNPAPEPGYDPRYGNNPYKGGFHPDRQGNELDKETVHVNGTIDPDHPNTEVEPEDLDTPRDPKRRH